MARYLAEYFQRELAPALTPLAFDPGHPFPHISNRSKNLAVAVKHEGRTKFARVKLPPVLPRFVALPASLAGDGVAFAFIEDVVCANVESLFPGTTIKSAHVFRVIRDTDMVIQEDEADDLLETVDQGLRQLRHGAPSPSTGRGTRCRGACSTSSSRTSRSTTTCWCERRIAWDSATGWS